jgi:hypothetical protein
MDHGEARSSLALATSGIDTMISVRTESSRLRRLFHDRLRFKISACGGGSGGRSRRYHSGLGTPLLKYEGVSDVVPIFRQHFPEALLLADMKTMDGGEGEANAVYSGGGNVIDFLALAGDPTASAVCAARDRFRQADPTIARLAFADVLITMQGAAEPAVETAERMLVAGGDGVASTCSTTPGGPTPPSLNAAT